MTNPLSLSSAVRRERCAGFTLVEILVVIAIIALLAAVSIVGLTTAIHSANRAKCLANLRSIGAGILTYGNDNNLDFPLADNDAWDIALNSYIGGQSTTAANPVLKCPEDSRPLSAGGKFARSYAFNGNLPAKTNQVPYPSNTIMIAEWYSGGATGPGGAESNYQYAPEFNTIAYSVGDIPAPAGKTGYHGATSNFVFVDGHAESLDPNTTVTPLSMWRTHR